jgi:hypothetical protein
LSSICDKKKKTKQNNIPPPPGHPPNIDSHHHISSSGKLPINATLKFDGTALYICTSGSIVSEGRFAIEIYKCRLAKKPLSIKRKN